MLIELNGHSFHIEIRPGQTATGPCARIANAASDLPPMDCPLTGAEGIAELVARYTGIAPDCQTRRKLAGLMAAQPIPVEAAIGVEPGFEPHVLFLMA